MTNQTTATTTAPAAELVRHADGDFTYRHAFAASLPRPVVAFDGADLVVDGVSYETAIDYDDGAWGLVDYAAAAPACQDAHDLGLITDAARAWWLTEAA